MMKIAIVDANLVSGGAEKLIVEMAPVIQEKGHEVSVIILSSYNDVFSSELKENKINLKFLSNSSNYWNLGNLFSLYMSLKNQDIIYVHIVQAQYFVSLLSIFFLKKIILITTEHSTNNRRRNSIIFRYLDRFVYSRYDKVISITKEVEENLIKHLGIIKSDKFVVIQNGVNIENIQKATPYDKAFFKYQENDKLIIMIGRFAPAKDQNTLIKSLLYLPENYKLLLVGDGSLIDESKKLVNTLSLQNRVNFLGFRNDIPKLLKMSDVGVLSSHWEGQPLSAIEIMAAGIPFVGSRVPGITELVEGYGILFDEYDSEECANIILSLTTNEEFYNKTILDCFKISQQYSLEKMVTAYFECANELV